MMSSDLPYDIIAQIIDNVGESDDIGLIKELALVSHSFHQICTKHLFATIDLHDEVPMRRASSKKGFVKLLKRRPEVVKYIRKLTYNVGYYSPSTPSSSIDDNMLSPILLNLLRTISFLNCFIISGSNLVNWYTVDSSLTSAFLHLMHLPTINHIHLSTIENFPISSLTTSVNLRQLDIYDLTLNDEEDGSPGIVVLSEMMPRIRGFHATESSRLTTQLLRAETQDGQRAFNLMDLRRLSMLSSNFFSSEESNRQYLSNLQYLLQNAKLLEKLRLSVTDEGILKQLFPPSARTLKELDLKLSLFSGYQPVPGLCEGLDAMAGRNMLEALSLEVNVHGSWTENFVGSALQKAEEALVKPGWSALRQVSFKVSTGSWGPWGAGSQRGPELCKALQFLPDKYLSHFSKLESVAFSYECKPYF